MKIAFHILYYVALAFLIFFVLTEDSNIYNAILVGYVGLASLIKGNDVDKGREG